MIEHKHLLGPFTTDKYPQVKKPFYFVNGEISHLELITVLQENKVEEHLLIGPVGDLTEEVLEPYFDGNLVGWVEKEMLERDVEWSEEDSYELKSNTFLLEIVKSKEDKKKKKS